MNTGFGIHSTMLTCRLIVSRILHGVIHDFIVTWKEPIIRHLGIYCVLYPTYSPILGFVKAITLICSYRFDKVGGSPHLQNLFEGFHMAVEDCSLEEIMLHGLPVYVGEETWIRSGHF